MLEEKMNKKSTIFAAAEFIIGLILLFRPEGFTSVIIVIVGCALCVLGALNSINYFRTEKSEAMKTNMLSKGLLCLIVGLFFAFNSKWFIATFPVTTILYGAFMLLLGVVKSQGAIDQFRFRVKYWYISFIGAIITILSSILIITNPFTEQEFIWKFIAIALLIEAATDIIGVIFNSKDELKYRDEIKN